MAKRVPPSIGWSPAQIGFHLKGFHNKVLAHVWAAQDGQYRGSVIGDDQILGPWPDEHTARRAMEAKVGQ